MVQQQLQSACSSATRTVAEDGTIGTIGTIELMGRRLTYPQMSLCLASQNGGDSDATTTTHKALDRRVSLVTCTRSSYCYPATLSEYDRHRHDVIEVIGTRAFCDRILMQCTFGSGKKRYICIRAGKMRKFASKVALL